MTIDEKKDILNQYLNKIRHLYRLCEMKKKIHKIREDNPEYYTAMKMEEQSEKMQKEIEILTPEIRTVRNDILAEIRRINTGNGKDDIYKDILKMRYIFGYKWEDIAIVTHYCYVYVISLHREALSLMFE